MKKNIVLSSVAAVAVAGMLVLSGCGGNSGSSTSSDVAGVSKGTIAVVKGGDSSLTVKVGDTKKDHGQNNVKITVRNSKCGTENTEAACPATAKVEIQIGCATVNAKNELTDGTSSEAANKAFAEFATQDAVVVADDEFVGYDGITVLTSDDVNTCSIDYSSFIVCAMDRNGKKYYVAKKLDAGQSGAEATTAVVEITTTLADGSKKTEWKEVTLKWETKVVDGKEIQGQPFVDLKDLALDGNLPATIKVFTVMKKAGSKSHGDKVTGVSGGTGAVGE